MIVRPDTDEEGRTALLDRIREIVAKDEGSVGKVEEWGKKRFAYEIDHVTEGFYYVVHFQAEPGTLAEVTRVLKITDAVLRTMVVRLSEPVLAGASTVTEE